MISLTTARELKERGLVWRPSLHDLFAIPDSDLDRIFVVSDMMIDVQQLFGRQIITFNGAVEWSLDNIMIADALWMPTESQLRELIQSSLANDPGSSIHLLGQGGKYRCQIMYGETTTIIEAVEPSDAYARALLHLYEQEQADLQDHPDPQDQDE